MQRQATGNELVAKLPRRETSRQQVLVVKGSPLNPEEVQRKGRHAELLPEARIPKFANVILNPGIYM